MSEYDQEKQIFTGCVRVLSSSPRRSLCLIIAPFTITRQSLDNQTSDQKHYNQANANV